MPDPVLGAADTTINTTDMVPACVGLWSGGERVNNWETGESERLDHVPRTSYYWLSGQAKPAQLQILGPSS